jgi:SnoaL-like domain
MAFDPVIQWARAVAAINERDWGTLEALAADDFHRVLVIGDLSGPPAHEYGKAAMLANSRAVAKRDWHMHTKSLVGLGDTVVATVEETFDDGSSQVAYAVVRFNDQGQAAQMYANVPVLAAALS